MSAPSTPKNVPAEIAAASSDAPAAHAAAQNTADKQNKFYNKSPAFYSPYYYQGYSYAPQGSNSPYKAQGSYMPSGTPITITKKSGEAVDLKKLHAAHHPELAAAPAAAPVAPAAAPVASPAKEATPEPADDKKAEIQNEFKKMVLQRKLAKEAAAREAAAKEAAAKEAAAKEAAAQATAQPEAETAKTETETAEAETTETTEVETTETETTETAETETETETTEEAPVEEEEEEIIYENSMSILFETLAQAKPIGDIFAFQYPETVTPPMERFKSETVKYRYDPLFLMQFEKPLSLPSDKAWREKMSSKIVIPPSTMRAPRSNTNRGDFSKFPPNFSKRGGRMDSRQNSRSKSKRQGSRRDDRKSRNSNYVSRKDRENGENGEESKPEEPKEEVKPLAKSANRWIPKSRIAATAEKKMAPDGVTELFEKADIEKKAKSHLNKLTLEKFDTISEDIIALANQSKWEEHGEALQTVLEQIFHKACDEPHWTSMYAQLCAKMCKVIDEEIKDVDILNTNGTPKTGGHLFLSYLLTRCHEEYSKGWVDKLPTNEDGSPLEPEMMSDEYYKAAAAKRRGLGLVRFIGHLYVLGLLNEKVIMGCIKDQIKNTVDPSDDTMENLVELLKTVGATVENTPSKLGIDSKVFFDFVFDAINEIIKQAPISSRIKFKLIDLTELRAQGWQDGKKDEGPKTIAEIHEEEAKKKEKEDKDRAMKQRSNRNTSSRTGSNWDRNAARGSSADLRKQGRNQSQGPNSFQQTPRNNSSRAPAQPQQQAPTETVTANRFAALLGDDDDE